jgi:hypothetical protein
MTGIVELLRDLRGVIEAASVPPDLREAIGEMEARSERSSFIPIQSLGMGCVLARDEVFVILKDRSFRPPPRPTVYMVEEMEGEWKPEDHVLTVEERSYRILGEEVLNGKDFYPPDARRIGESFVFFPERRNNPKIPSYFLIPPIEFAELEERSEGLGITNIWSVSPSALTDQDIRTRLSYPQDDAYATILIGCDRR